MKNCNKKIYALWLTVKYFHVSRQKELKFWLLISLLQLAIHVVQNRRAGKQKSHWDKILTKKITISNYVCLLFVLSQCNFCSPAWWFPTT